jgi:hypothetical protein
VPDTDPPVIIQGPVVSKISATQTLITWTTDKIADSQVSYHLTGQSPSRIVGDTAQGFDHAVILTNLTPLTDYQFTVTSFDPAGNQVTSDVFDLRLSPTSVTLISVTTRVPPFADGLPVLAVGMLLSLVGWMVYKRKTKQIAI